MACLRAADAGVLETANVNICAAEFSGEFQYVPVVDGTFIQDSPVATISRGKLNGVITTPFMIDSRLKEVIGSPTGYHEYI